MPRPTVLCALKAAESFLETPWSGLGKRRSHSGADPWVSRKPRRAEQRLVGAQRPGTGSRHPPGPSQAQIEPSALSYVEAHGTGTSLGDPIEIDALARVFQPGRNAEAPVALGSVKTNLGHLEAAAGIAGLLKVVLMLEHGKIPPHLHLKQPSPHIAWEKYPFMIPTQLTDWEPVDGKRIAGVSSFGFSGSNAHVILEGAPEATIPAVGWSVPCNS